VKKLASAWNDSVRGGGEEMSEIGGSEGSNGGILT
jgi:hypothetical protein